MRTIITRPCLCFAMLLGSALPTRMAAAQGAQLPAFLELRVPKAPTLGRGDGKSFLAYELHLTNLGVQPLTLKSVEVLAADGSRGALLTLSDSVLRQSLGRPGVTIPAAERMTLGGGLRGVVFVWVPIEGAVPKALRHRVTVQTGAGDSLRTQSLEGGWTTVVRDAGITPE